MSPYSDLWGNLVIGPKLARHGQDLFSFILIHDVLEFGSKTCDS